MTAALLGAFGLVALLLPITAAVLLTIALLSGVEFPERSVHRIVSITFVMSLVATLGADVLVAVQRGEGTVVTLAHWLVVPSYLLDVRLVFDTQAAVLMTLTALLCGLIGFFSSSYLHRDPGFRRFYVLLLLFAAGMMAIAAGDTLDLIYAGWETVGIASALLIAYFHEREAPVRHGLRAFAVYRVCDVALLSAAVILHHELHDASLGTLHGEIDPQLGLILGLLLLVATMGKAASFPFTGWLPRAMEGPTPSSAIFYGALSIHAGPFLLLRTWPMLEDQLWVRVAIFAVGLITAAHATMSGRVQTDIKATLGYASVTQVALIFIEISLGFTTLALVHLAGHAVLRTWQLLRAPSVLQEHNEVVGLLGGRPPKRGAFWEAVLPLPLRRFGYRLATERWAIDEVGWSVFVAPFVNLLRRLDRADQGAMRLLARPDTEEGGAS